MSAVIIVGHNSARRGARNYLEESEYSFNTRIARRVEALCGVEFMTKDTANKIHAILKYDLAIELHFNYFTGTANGSEALVISGDVKSSEVSKKLLTSLTEKFSLRNRGVKELRPTDRGYANLVQLKRFSDKSLILEPCFQAEREIFSNEEEYALLLAEFLRKYISNKLEPKIEGERLWRKLFKYLSELLQSLKCNSLVKTQSSES